MSTKLSEAQAETLRRMAADTGRLERIKGGYWVTPHTLPGKHGFAYEWWAVSTTVRALEGRGLVERTHEVAEDWRDSRRITDAGLAAVAATVEADGDRRRRDIAELRVRLGAKHVKVEGTLAALGLDDADAYECVACRVAWPCDVAKLLAVLS